MTTTQVLVIVGAFVVAVPLEDALALMTVPAIATNMWQAIYGGNLRKLMRRFSIMAVASVAALIFVAVTFGQLGSQKAMAWIGVILMVDAVLAFAAWRPAVSRAAERWTNPLVGLASGAVTGITGVAAVPFLPYMQSLDIDRHELVQALGIVFLFINGALTPALAMQGAFHATNLLGAIAAVAPTFAGVWVGQKARHAVSAETFRRIFLIGMLATGLHRAHGLL